MRTDAKSLRMAFTANLSPTHALVGKRTNLLHKYKDGGFVKVGELTRSVVRDILMVVNNTLYYFWDYGHYTRIFKYDFSTNTSIELGSIPGFIEKFYTQGGTELSFVGSNVLSGNSSSAYNYPFFVVNIVE